MTEHTNRIKEIRTGKGLTLEAVAEIANTTHEQIRRLENGQRRLTQGWMIRIAKALEVEPFELLNAKNARFPDNTSTQGVLAENMANAGLEKRIYQSALIREICASPAEDVEAKIASALNKYNEEFKKTTGRDPTADSVRTYLMSIKPLFID